MPIERPILVVEDDQTLREGLCDALAGQGYTVHSASDGWQAQEKLRGGGWSLVVLDLMLPGPGGLEILRAFRQTDRETPVLILTARGDEGDKVIGLELGADDYVTKPYGLRELLARVAAHLRRSALHQEVVAAGPLRLGACEVDLAAFEVRRGGEAMALSPKEAAILELLWAEAGKAVDRGVLLDRIWGRGRYVTGRTIDTHILHLRQKLEDDPKAPRHLLTVHGIGYRLVLDAATDS
ncbi:MAG: response regulator transcription factor [Planctomycetota bacterium]